MNEYQDIKVTKTLGVSSWSFIQEVDDCKVYQADDAESTLFAVGIDTNYISFEVYPDEATDSFYIY